jgi:hypothetical protein
LDKKIFIKISKIIFISLFAAAFIFINNNISLANEEKDMILILDTSYTMSGGAPGAKNILPQVKKSLPQFIDQLDKDDSITLITFDTEVKLFPTVYISDKKNKDSLVEYINNIQAKGAWTYTSRMMKEAFRKAQELEQKDKDRQRVIVILTDTIDDPPPGMHKDRLNIKDVAKNYKDKDWFIFFINFGEALNNNQKLVKMQKELTTSVSKYTKVIETSPLTEDNKKAADKTAKTAQKNIDTGIKKTVEKDLPDDITKMEKEAAQDKAPSFPFKTLFIALLIILIILAVIYYFKKHAGQLVQGKLEYWDHTMITPYYENYDLTKQNLKEILVGPKNAHNLTIRDIEITDPFRITAIRANGEVKSTVQAGKGYLIEHVNREPSAYLKNGDMFKVSNYTFKYTS